MSSLQQSSRISMNSFSFSSSPCLAAASRENFFSIEFNQSPAPGLWRVLLLTALAVLLLRTSFAQVPPHIPPPGISVPESDRQELTVNAAALEKEIADLANHFRTNSHNLALLPDIEIFHKAVDWALRYNEFFETKQ